MYTIEWNDDHSVGIKAIDDQHKELVKITNTLFQAIMDDRGFDILMEVLRELEAYVKVHFDFEEELMRRHGYSPIGLKEHIEEHETLTKQVSDFVDQVAAAGDTLDMEVFDFLRDWTDSHLLETDMQYKDFFQYLSIE